MREGDILGSYEVLGELGQGGMGVVFLARHRDHQSDVAIKVLNASYSTDERLIKRFWGEAKAAAQIHHPGIAHVHDVGRTEDGAAYLVMDYLRGETLRARIRREGPMAERDVIAFTRQLGSVLAAAHAVGIIHRDIKPENIFLVPDTSVAGRERIKLLDFGVAKLATDDQTLNLTRTGDVIGTPMYMSPEQCRGTGSYDARTDLYALGCVVFEMVCGHPPFVFKFPGDIMAAHIATPAPPARQLRPDCSVELEGLIKRLLEKDPDNRLESAQTLLVHLERLEDDDSTVLDSAPAMTILPNLMAATIAPPQGKRRDADDLTTTKLVRPSRDELVDTDQQLGPGAAAHPIQTTLSAAGVVGLAPGALPRRRSPWLYLGGLGAIGAALAVAFAFAGRSPDATDVPATTTLPTKSHSIAHPRDHRVVLPAPEAPASPADESIELDAGEVAARPTHSKRRDKKPETPMAPKKTLGDNDTVNPFGH